MYSYKCKKNKCYAKAYIELQTYENLFTVNDALIQGTIFKDLYSPYKTGKSNCKKVIYGE